MKYWPFICLLVGCSSQNESSVIETPDVSVSTDTMVDQVAEYEYLFPDHTFESENAVFLQSILENKSLDIFYRNIAELGSCDWNEIEGTILKPKMDALIQLMKAEGNLQQQYIYIAAASLQNAPNEFKVAFEAFRQKDSTLFELLNSEHKLPSNWSSSK